MRLADYYRGQRLTLLSRLQPAEVQGRINDSTGSMFTPFAAGVVGWAGFGRLWLRHRTGWLRNDLRPIMVGTIRPEGAGSRLELNFRAPLFMYFAPILWCLAACFALLVALVIAGDMKGEPGWILFPLAIGALIIAVPWVHLHFALAQGDAAQAAIIAFLREAADARDAGRA